MKRYLGFTHRCRYFEYKFLYTRTIIHIVDILGSGEQDGSDI